MDYVSSGKNFNKKNNLRVQYYLFVININTKFLIIERTVEALEIVFNKLKPHKIDNLRGDADTAFGRSDYDSDLKEDSDSEEEETPTTVTPVGKKLFMNYLKSKGVRHVFLSSSKFTNKNRCVDRVIRTIRDMIGLKTDKLFNPEIISQNVDIYNKTPHLAYDHKFTPFEV
jgi:hypothetical protein